MADERQAQAARLQAEITDLESRRTTLTATELNNLNDKIVALQSINELLRKSAEYQQQRIKDLETENVLLDRNAGYNASRNERLEAFLIKEQNLLQIQEIKLSKLKQELVVLNETAGVAEDVKAAKLDEIINQAKFNDLKRDELKIAEKLGQQTKEIISATMGISSRWKDTFFGKLLDKDSDSVKNMKAISASIKDTVNIQNFVGSTLMKIQEATAIAFFAYDSAAASLAKVAGANEQLLGVLNDTARGATAYGISFEQAGRAIEGLYSNLNTFSTLNKGVQEQLTISVAKLDRLGISSADSAKTIGTLTQIMGMSEAQAAKTSEELAGFAIAIGKPPQQVAQDFAGASNQLAGYGKNMVNVFKDLEIQSQATGVAVNDLISITEKFQTFEGAATAAGKLNAALGGGFINAMELLEASAENPAKAIDLLRTRLDEANISFEEMDFFEQKMIMDAGGFKSIEEASRILSQTNAQREEEIAQKQKLANQQKMLAEAIQRSIPLQEKLTMIFVNFGIVMGPIVDGISGFLSVVAALFDKVPYLSYVLAGLLVIIGGFLIVGKMVVGLEAFIFALKSLGIVSATVAPAAAPVAAGIGTISTAMGAGATPVGAFGIALGSVVLPIAALVASIALLVAAQALAIHGFAELFDVILGKGDGVATTLATLGAAMFAIGIAFNNPIILLGMFNFAAALMGVALAMNFLPEKKVISFATISENLVKLGEVEGSNKALEQATTLVNAINDISIGLPTAFMLERILKAAMPQQQAAQAPPSQSAPIIKIFIGDKEIKGLITKVVAGTGSDIATLGGS
jgi:hypothetical protein